MLRMIDVQAITHPFTMSQSSSQQQLGRFEANAKTVGKVIHLLIVVSLVLFVGGALAGFFGFAKAVAYIGALSWFLLEWFRGNLLERANVQYKKELDRLTRRVESYQTQIRIEKGRPYKL